ncbi:hypothetical protein [Actinomadura sp. NTSP31]|uniref:hypothetical protein n=1 Tax=Actinomadura sp. NTSP31 TaxID=1735447 RepID=UPI0035C10342
MGDRLARLAAVAVLAVAAAGCGVRPTGIIGAGRPVQANGSPGTITVYLAWQGHVVPAVRPGLPGHPYLSVSQLSIPVTSDERRRGLYTEVDQPLVARMPQDSSEPRGMGVLVVDLSSAVPRRPVRWSRMALAQIACTAQAMPGVNDVQLWSAPSLSDDGWGNTQCAEYRDLMR